MATRSKKRAAARAEKFGSISRDKQPHENRAMEPVQTGTGSALPDAEIAGANRGLTSDLLLDPLRVREDLELTEVMVQGVWKQGPEKRRQLLERLHQIAHKTSATIFTKMGPVESETAADELAVKAMRLAVLIEQQDQKDRHHVDKMNRPSAGTVNIDNRRVIILPPNGRESRAIEQ